MAFDEGLATRIREVLHERNTTEKRMFGSLAFLLNGHMFVGIVGDTLMARVGPNDYARALEEPLNKSAMSRVGLIQRFL